MNSISVLYVDDDRMNHFIVRHALSKGDQQFDVQYASTVDDAKELYFQHKPDILLLDINLGHESIDGIDLANELNQDRIVPVIFVTSHDDSSILDRISEHEHYSYILKPIGEEKLATYISLKYISFEKWMRSQEEQQLVNLFFKQSMSGIFLIQFDKNVKTKDDFPYDLSLIKYNDTFKKLLHFEEDRNSDTTTILTELIQPNRQLFESILKEIITKKSYRDEVKFVLHDSSERFFEIECQRVDQYQHYDSLILGTIQDITDRKKIQFQNELLANAIGQIQESVVVTTGKLESPHPTIIYVNKKACEMTGYDQSELIGESPRIFQGEETNRELLVSLKTELSKGNTFTGKTVNYRKDGTRYDVEWDIYPFFNQTDKENYFISIQRDITQKLQSKREYERSILLLKLIFNQNQLSNILIGEDHNVIMANDVAKEYAYHVFQKNLNAGLSIYEFVREEDIESFNTHFQRCLKGEVVHTDKQFRFDGKEVWLSVTYTPFFDHITQQSAVLMSSHDITERKLAQKKLLEMNNRLELIVENRTELLIEAVKEAEENAKVKDQFLANMSHEIRTPLNGIRGMIQLLRDTRLDDHQDEYLGTLSDSANSLLTIVNDILDFEKIQAGKLSIEKQPFDFYSLLFGIKRHVESSILNKNIHFRVKIAEFVPNYIESDQVRIRQILLNLLDNAVKFTNEGSIQLHVNYFLQGEASFVQFIISDTGIGMEKENRDRIFEAFEQADTTITRLYGGTGLGLSITTKLIELLEGNINLESEKNVGTTFTIEIP